MNAAMPKPHGRKPTSSFGKSMDAVSIAANALKSTVSVPME